MGRYYIFREVGMDMFSGLELKTLDDRGGQG